MPLDFVLFLDNLFKFIGLDSPIVLRPRLDKQFNKTLRVHLGDLIYNLFELIFSDKYF